MRRLLHVPLRCLVLVVLGFSPVAWSLQPGDSLKPLSIASKPANFDYKPNGLNQLIMVYPADLSSRKIRGFHARILKAGFCPLSIVDMENRAWYSPLSLAESEIAREMKQSLNPKCTVTADYSSIANKHWGVDVGPLSIVVDGKGVVVFIVHGVPLPAQEQKIIALLGGAKPESLTNPGAHTNPPTVASNP